MRKLILVRGGYEIELGKIHANEIDIELIEYLLEEIDKEKKPCVEYTTTTDITYELCRDMLMSNRFTLNIYYKV